MQAAHFMKRLGILFCWKGVNRITAQEREAMLSEQPVKASFDMDGCSVPVLCAQGRRLLTAQNGDHFAKDADFSFVPTCCIGNDAADNLGEPRLVRHAAYHEQRQHAVCFNGYIVDVAGLRRR